MASVSRDEKSSDPTPRQSGTDGLTLPRPLESHGQQGQSSRHSDPDPDRWNQPSLINGVLEEVSHRQQKDADSHPAEEHLGEGPYPEALEER
jgi:hypothetical protein